MKIKLSVLNKIFTYCTSEEINLLLYTGQFQNEHGEIKGIDYKNAMDTLKLSRSYFYKSLSSLEEKNIIEIDYKNDHYGFWNFKILDNDFSNKKSYKEGYLNLNQKILHTEQFYEMKKNEKILVINILKLNQNKRVSIQIGLEKLYEWISVTKQSMDKYIRTLKNVFNLRVKNKILTIDCINTNAFDRREETELEVYANHILKFELVNGKYVDRKNPDFSDHEIKDTIKLFSQYNRIFSVSFINQKIKEVLNEKGQIISSYINKILSLIYKGVSRKKYT